MERKRLTDYTDNKRNKVPCFCFDDLVGVEGTGYEIEDCEYDGGGQRGIVAKEDEALIVGITPLWDLICSVGHDDEGLGIRKRPKNIGLNPGIVLGAVKLKVRAVF